MSFGADKSMVERMILKQGLKLTLPAVGIGAAAALGIGPRQRWASPAFSAACFSKCSAKIPCSSAPTSGLSQSNLIHGKGVYTVCPFKANRSC